MLELIKFIAAYAVYKWRKFRIESGVFDPEPDLVIPPGNVAIVSFTMLVTDQHGFITRSNLLAYFLNSGVAPLQATFADVQECLPAPYSQACSRAFFAFVAPSTFLELPSDGVIDLRAYWNARSLLQGVV